MKKPAPDGRLEPLRARLTLLGLKAAGPNAAVPAPGVAPEGGASAKPGPVAMAGAGMSSVDELQRLLGRWTPGEVLAVTVLRNGGHRHEVEVVPIDDQAPSRPVAN